MLRVKVWIVATAMWAAVLYLVCLGGKLVWTGGYHETLLEVVLPGFKWLTAAGFAIGLAWSFAYGAVAGGLFAAIHNVVYRWGAASESGR